MTLLTAGALTDPQLPATASTCARLGGVGRAAIFFLLTMLRQHSQYDSRLGFSFRVLVRVRVRVSVRGRSQLSTFMKAYTAYAF